MLADGRKFRDSGSAFLDHSLDRPPLSNQAFGVYNYITVLVTFGFILVEFGLKNLGIRELSQGRGSQALVKLILKLRFALATLGSLAVVVMTRFAFGSSTYLWPSVVLGASLFVDALLLDFILISNERLSAQALSNIAQALFLYIAAYFLVHGENDFLILTILYFLSHVVWVGLFYFASDPFKTLIQRNQEEMNSLELLKGGFGVFASAMISGFQVSAGVLLLGFFHQQIWLGDYSAALKIVGVTLAIINALISAIQPRFARESHALRSPKMLEMIVSTTRVLWIFLIPTIVGCWLFGDQIVLWCFGESFKGSAQFLKPLSLVLAFYSIRLAPLWALLVSSEGKTMVSVTMKTCAITWICASAVLAMGRPEEIGWALVFAEIICVVITWRPFGIPTRWNLDGVKILFLPTVLMIAGLMIQAPSWMRFGLSALGYIIGLFIAKIWERPWFTTVWNR